MKPEMFVCIKLNEVWFDPVFYSKQHLHDIFTSFVNKVETSALNNTDKKVLHVRFTSTLKNNFVISAEIGALYMC